MASNDFLNASSNILGKARHLVKCLKCNEAALDDEDTKELQHIVGKCIALCKATSEGNESVRAALEDIAKHRDADEESVKPRHNSSKGPRTLNALRERKASEGKRKLHQRDSSFFITGSPSSVENRPRRRKTDGALEDGGVSSRVPYCASSGAEKMKLRGKRKNFNPNSPRSKKKGCCPNEDA